MHNITFTKGGKSITWNQMSSNTELLMAAEILTAFQGQSNDYACLKWCFNQGAQVCMTENIVSSNTY